MFATLILPSSHSASREQPVKAESKGQPQYKCYFTKDGHTCELVGGATNGGGEVPLPSGSSTKQEKASGKPEPPSVKENSNAAEPMDNVALDADATTDDNDGDLFNDYGPTDPGAS
uniref:Uncharacterized protein n=1 Tax=Romanomermis culicivorax TaxID=13658 RepID=A0A915HTM9_ROMCU